MRVKVFHPDELVGMWYFALNGTGIWLNLGSTCVLTTAQDLDYYHIPREYYELLPALPLMFQMRLRGCDTVQLPLSSQGIRNTRFEVIDLRLSGVDQSETTFDVRTCGHDYRAGWDASLPCECDANYSILNCGIRHLLGPESTTKRGFTQRMSIATVCHNMETSSRHAGWHRIWKNIIEQLYFVCNSSVMDDRKDLRASS